MTTKNSLTFGEFLAALKRKGKVATAKALKTSVYKHLTPVLSPAKINKLLIDEIVQIFDLSAFLLNELRKSAPASPLRRRVYELEAQGFHVSLGAKYSHE